MGKLKAITFFSGYLTCINVANTKVNVTSEIDRAKNEKSGPKDEERTENVDHKVYGHSTAVQTTVTTQSTSTAATLTNGQFWGIIIIIIAGICLFMACIFVCAKKHGHKLKKYVDKWVVKEGGQQVCLADEHAHSGNGRRAHAHSWDAHAHGEDAHANSGDAHARSGDAHSHSGDEQGVVLALLS